MARLEYRTRGKSTPQGKARVFFCCHPEDRELYLEEIAQDLLAVQSCAVWFDADPLAPYDGEALRESISQMQLMVICVTRKLLTQPSRAMQVEYALAQEYHIPVLPLMQERGLDGLFARRFGNLQYLDKHVTEDGALSFTEKLSQFLAGVLVQDEEAEKIRAAFDGYIFLSYRKKDRRHARELMRLIHRQDFCRDVAIWYDEFLTPGEDFNREIERALEKSALFAMAITPNVAEKGNYIMTTEYPLARKRHKPILPVEMAPTEQNSVAGHYKNLPAVVKATDGEALRDGLMKALSGLPLRQKDESPEHHYLMGLAYLGGVDVEVDAARAVELLTLAAKKQYMPAVEKLINMYENGQGVAVNPDEAIRWRREEIRAYFVGTMPDLQMDEKMRRHVFAIYQLATYLEGLGRWDEAFEEYKNLCLFSGSKWGKATSEEQAHRYYVEMLLAAKGYEGQCDYWREKGEYRKALKCAKTALEIFENGNKMGYPMDSTGLSPDVTLSDVYLDIGDVRAAAECLSRYKEHLKAAKKEERPVQAHNYLLAPARRADVFRREGMEQEAMRLLREVVAVRRELIERSGEAMLWHGFLQALMSLAELYTETEKHREAEECYREAIAVSRRLALHSGSDLAAINEKEGWQGLGWLYSEEGRLPEALECYQRAAALICERTAEDDAVVELRQFARICLSWQDAEEALSLLSHALKLLTLYEEGDRGMHALRRRAAVTEDDGLALGQTGRHDLACLQLCEAEELRRKVYKKTDAALDGIMLGRTCTDLGKELLAAGEEAKGRRKLKEALSLLEKLQRERDGAYLRRSIRECKAALEGGKQKTALSRALEEQVRVAREEPEGRFAMAERYLYFAKTFHRVGGYTDCAEAYAKARDILLALEVGGAALPFLCETLDGCLLSLGHTYLQIKNGAQAEETYLLLLSRLALKTQEQYGEDLSRLREKAHLALLGLSREQNRYADVEAQLEALLSIRRNAPSERRALPLSCTLLALGRLKRAQGDFGGALAVLEEAAELRRPPEGRKGTLAERWLMKQVREEQVGVSEDAHDGEARERYAKERKSELWAIDLLWDQEARAAKKQGNYARAETLLLRCIEIEEMLVREFPSLTLRSNLSISCMEMGNLLNSLGDREEKSNEFNFSYDYASANAYWGRAWRFYRRAADLREALYRETGEKKHAERLIATYDKLSGVCGAGEDSLSSVDYRDKIILLRERLNGEEPCDETERALGNAYNSKGNVLCEDDPGEALRAYDRALSIRMPLAERTGSEEDLDALANTYYNIASSLAAGDGTHALEDGLLTAVEVAARYYGRETEGALVRGGHLDGDVRAQVVAHYGMAIRTWETLMERYPASAEKHRDTVERTRRLASQYDY